MKSNKGGFSLWINHFCKARVELMRKMLFLDFYRTPSPIIGNACMSLTDSLTDSCLVNLIDVTLACEDDNSNLLRLLLLLMLMMRNVLVVVMKFNLGCKFTFC